jgi:DHA1 family multidrug resistance protein-like MFS transporter
MPQLIVITVYICLIYGILYLSFYAIPYSFIRERGWTRTQASLPFISIFVGTLISIPGVAFYSKTYYQRRLTARGKVWPEDRLPMMLVGGILLPLGLFWFAWTSSREVSWVAPVFACAPIGAGIALVFQSGIAYIIDVYLTSSASALAANTFVRSFVAAGFPLFAPAMYDRLGVAWATSLLGFLCTALVPAPIIFYYYGERVRAMSKYTAKL